VLGSKCFYISQYTTAFAVEPVALQEPLWDIDVAAQHKALQERTQEHAQHREMGIYRHGSRMVRFVHYCKTGTHKRE